MEEAAFMMFSRMRARPPPRLLHARRGRLKRPAVGAFEVPAGAAQIEQDRQERDQIGPIGSLDVAGAHPGPRGGETGAQRVLAQQKTPGERRETARLQGAGPEQVQHQGRVGAQRKIAVEIGREAPDGPLQKREAGRFDQDRPLGQVVQRADRNVGGQLGVAQRRQYSRMDAIRAFAEPPAAQQRRQHRDEADLIFGKAAVVALGQGLKGRSRQVVARAHPLLDEHVREIAPGRPAPAGIRPPVARSVRHVGEPAARQVVPEVARRPVPQPALQVKRQLGRLFPRRRGVHAGPAKSATTRLRSPVTR